PWGGARALRTNFEKIEHLQPTRCCRRRLPIWINCGTGTQIGSPLPLLKLWMRRESRHGWVLMFSGGPKWARANRWAHTETAGLGLHRSAAPDLQRIAVITPMVDKGGPAPRTGSADGPSNMAPTQSAAPAGGAMATQRITMRQSREIHQQKWLLGQVFS